MKHTQSLTQNKLEKKSKKKTHTQKIVHVWSKIGCAVHRLSTIGIPLCICAIHYSIIYGYIVWRGCYAYDRSIILLSYKNKKQRISTSLGKQCDRLRALAHAPILSVLMLRKIIAKRVLQSLYEYVDRENAFIVWRNSVILHESEWPIKTYIYLFICDAYTWFCLRLLQIAKSKYSREKRNNAEQTNKIPKTLLQFHKQNV